MRNYASILFAGLVLGPLVSVQAQTASPQANRNPPAFADEPLPPLPSSVPAPPAPPAVPQAQAQAQAQARPQTQAADDQADDRRTITIRLDRSGRPQADQYAAPAPAPTTAAREFTVRIERPAPPPRELRIRVEADQQQYATPPPQTFVLRLGDDTPAPAQYAAPVVAAPVAAASPVQLASFAASSPGVSVATGFQTTEYPTFFGSWVGEIGASLELYRRPRLITYLPPVGVQSVQVQIPAPTPVVYQAASPVAQYAVQAPAPATVQYSMQAPAPIPFAVPAPCPAAAVMASPQSAIMAKCRRLLHH